MKSSSKPNGIERDKPETIHLRSIYHASMARVNSRPEKERQKKRTLRSVATRSG